MPNRWGRKPRRTEVPSAAMNTTRQGSQPNRVSEFEQTADSGPSRLARWRATKASKPRQKIVGLLKTIGVPDPMLYAPRASQNGSFWTRSINHLAVLELARKLYRVQIIYLHPDKPGGSLKRAVELNTMWDQIEKRFRHHGHELVK
jgi:hypothetical protein